MVADSPLMIKLKIRIWDLPKSFFSQRMKKTSGTIEEVHQSAGKLRGEVI